MATETELLNGALAEIGATRINAIDDGTPNANHCLTLYPALLDSILRMSHWNFATMRATLALRVDAPVFEFVYAYSLPSDYIKLREYYDSYNSLIIPWNDYGYTRYISKFRVESMKPDGSPDGTPAQLVVLSNGSSAQIVYTKRVTNPDLWDGAFYECVQTWLASKLANAIAKNERRADVLDSKAKAMLALASSIDGQEQSVEPFHVDDLIWGR